MQRTTIARLLLMLACSFGALQAHADEGMWTFDNLPKAQIATKYGFTLTQPWIDKTMHAALRLAGGCSGSFVSSAGLVLTNHHCARQCVAQLSNKERDYVETGFLAKRPEDEIKCPEIELNRLDTISDVTAEVKAATKGLAGRDYTAAKDAVTARLTSACVGSAKATTRCDLVDLYHGGIYQLYKYHRYSDARLVFAPEEAIAFFGGDPDNFNFPRYDLDMAVLRAYEDGKPAKVAAYFPFSRSGAAPGELTFVAGHPGSTDRQLTVAQLEGQRDAGLLHRLLYLSELRGVLLQYGKQSAEAARISNTTLFGVENSYKALYGELEALQNPALLQRKRAEEASLRSYVAQHPDVAAAAGAWDAIAASQRTYRDMEFEYAYIGQGRGFATKYFRFARTLVRAAAERSKPNEQRLPEFADAHTPEIEQALFSKAPIYPDFEAAQFAWSLTKLRELVGVDAPTVQQVLGNESPDQLAQRMIAATQLGDPAVRRALWDGGADAVAASTDPFIVLARQIDPQARALRTRFEADVESVESRNAELIAQARFAQTGTSVYPDATFTLRLSYGKVAGWEARGKPVAPYTQIGGAFQRATGAAPFALPPSWLAAKDRLNASQPFDFVTDNDIIGGNSGSPMVNRQGEIVGLVFDGNIESLGGAYWFDPTVNRTVAVHSGAILEALDKVYGAGALVQEMTHR